MLFAEDGHGKTQQDNLVLSRSRVQKSVLWNDIYDSYFRYVVELNQESIDQITLCQAKMSHYFGSSDSVHHVILNAYL